MSDITKDVADMVEAIRYQTGMPAASHWHQHLEAIARRLCAAEAEVARLRGQDGEVWREGERCRCRFAPGVDKVIATCEFHLRLAEQGVAAEKERDTANARELHYWGVLATVENAMASVRIGTWTVLDERFREALKECHEAVVALPHAELALHKARLAVVEAVRLWLRGNGDRCSKHAGSEIELGRIFDALEALEARP